MSNRYKILAEASGGKLSEQDVYNLETYGVKHPSEFAPDPADEPKPGYCVCGCLLYTSPSPRDRG